VAKPKWQVVPGARFDPGDPPRLLAWVSGRAWIGFVRPNKRLALTSARPAGNSLTGFSTAEVAGIGESWEVPIVGTELVFP